MQSKLVKLTAAQHDAVNQILMATDENFTALVRRLIEAEAKRHGIDFPQDAPPKSNIHDNSNKKRKA